MWSESVCQNKQCEVFDIRAENVRSFNANHTDSLNNFKRLFCEQETYKRIYLIYDMNFIYTEY